MHLYQTNKKIKMELIKKPNNHTVKPDGTTNRTSKDLLFKWQHTVLCVQVWQAREHQQEKFSFMWTITERHICTLSRTFDCLQLVQHILIVLHYGKLSHFYLWFIVFVSTFISIGGIALGQRRAIYILFYFLNHNPLLSFEKVDTACLPLRNRMTFNDLLH